MIKYIYTIIISGGFFMKKLYKSNVDKKLCGVCGGIAEYLNIDSTIVRLLWVVFALCGAGIIVYIIAALIMPNIMQD